MARSARRTGNIPAEVSTFIGRRHELTEVKKKLADARVVSLVGPGGVGKTRLAIRLAADLGRGFSDGAWLVELAEVIDPALVTNTTLAAVDLRDQAATDPAAMLASYLRDKELLLIVDNCEHLLEAAAQLVTDMTRTAPGLRVLATSREPLGVAGEHVVPVPPLDLPPPDATASVAELQGNEAVVLFTNRAAAASGAFDLTTSNRAAVADICRKLDGLPLAIELAAVRTRVLTVQQISDRLSDRFALLTGGGRAALPRHQTLRTTIEWSHDLLSDAERAILRRCSVFAGRFTLPDVESVCAGDDIAPDQVLELLSALVDKSLLAREDARGAACYRMHETMREFARLKLAAAAEELEFERRCTDYYLRICQRSALQGRYQILDWLDWADLEMDNVRAVLKRCLMHSDQDRGIAFGAALFWFWATRATSEGIRWLDAFLQMGDGDPAWQGWAYFIRGYLATLKGDAPGALTAVRTAVAHGRQHGQQAVLTEALVIASIAENMAGDTEAAARLIDEAQDAIAGVDYVSGAISVQQAKSVHGFFTGDYEAVRVAALEGERLARAAGDRYAIEMMLLNRGSAALLDGAVAEAEPLLAESLRLADQIDDLVAQFILLGVLGCHAARSGQPRRAAHLLGAAEAVQARVGAKAMPFFVPLIAGAEESATAALGANKFASEIEAGRKLRRDQAVALALGRRPASTSDTDSAITGMLGRREEEVARLIADGLTNRQIGAKLFISERTVDSHVRNILNKLGFNSRAQIAGWIAASGN
jgi:predicted ATPase/DNA-binding CsgD family transcriptional regulator